MLVLCLLLSNSRAEAIEERDLCWKGVCAGMTLTEVKSRLKSLGYDVDSRWLARLVERLRPKIGGVYEFEGYTEWISANRGADCPQDAPERKSCSSLFLGFVRFPSGRLRLYSFEGAETVSSVRYASDVIDGLKTLYGDPGRELWASAPQWARSTYRWTVWEGWWPSGRRGEWLSVHLHVNSELPVEDGSLSPPELSKSLKIDSIDHSFHSVPIGFAAESAWIAEFAGWIEDPKTKCRVWNSFPRETDTITWNGACKRGYVTGQGTVRWFDNGDEYEVNTGEFRKGKLNGHAVVTTHFGRLRFEGEFLDHLPHGYGVLQKDGDTYSGNWVKGCLTLDGKSITFFTHRDTCEKF